MSLPGIPAYSLNERYFLIHKTGAATTGFGLDHTPVLVGNGFGLYSCVNLRDEIGPLKSDFYRVALCLQGSLDVQLGLETFRHQPNTIHFHGSNQPFMFSRKSADLVAYYLLFTPAFVEDLLPEPELKIRYPFFDYRQTPFFTLSEADVQSLKMLFSALSDESMAQLPFTVR